MPTIRTSVEGPRGCGYRKGGGFYFVLYEGQGFSCGKLPIPLTVCPTCGEGFSHSRGITWINPQEVAPFQPCGKSSSQCNVCPMTQIDKAAMIWIGKEFYPHPENFLEEAQRMGISRRIQAPPKGFVIGEDWVFLAHLRGIHDPEHEHASDEGYVPALFYAFKPTAIEYVVNGNEPEEELTRLEERGVSLVSVVKKTSQQTLFEE